MSTNASIINDTPLTYNITPQLVWTVDKEPSSLEYLSPLIIILLCTILAILSLFSIVLCSCTFRQSKSYPEEHKYSVNETYLNSLNRHHLLPSYQTKRPPDVLICDGDSEFSLDDYKNGSRKVSMASTTYSLSLPKHKVSWGLTNEADYRPMTHCTSFINSDHPQGKQQKGVLKNHHISMDRVTSL